MKFGCSLSTRSHLCAYSLTQTRTLGHAVHVCLATPPTVSCSHTLGGASTPKATSDSMANLQ